MWCKNMGGADLPLQILTEGILIDAVDGVIHMYGTETIPYTSFQ